MEVSILLHLQHQVKTMHQVLVIRLLYLKMLKPQVKCFDDDDNEV